jgi:outer membrane protein
MRRIIPAKFRSYVPLVALGILLAISSSSALARSKTPDSLGISVPLDQLSSVLSPTDVIAVAKRLILARQTDPARRLLEDIADTAPDKVEVQFLLASIAVMEKRFDDAIDRYRDILTDQPGLTRVRLELARTLFLNREDEAAEHHFRLVLATEDGSAVATNIRKFLDQIWQRRTFRYTFALAVAPDSNINVAPADERVDLFGLPFTLDDDA